MGWRTVHIKQSDCLKLRLDNLEITKENNKYYIPLSDINMLIVEGNTSLTTNILSALSANDVVTIICDRKYMPNTFILNYGGYHHSAKRANIQISWEQDFKSKVWEKIVQQKMVNQLDFLQNFKNPETPQDRLDKMRELIDSMEDGDRTNREGLVAKVYFNTLYGLNFSRNNDDYIINSAMDYGYAIIRAAIARIVVSQGLIPSFGIRHKNEYNSFNLVDDLMEPFRPLMDYWLTEIVIQDQDYLSYETRLKIIDFINQDMFCEGQKSSVENVMERYVISFFSAMTQETPDRLISIQLNDFVEAQDL